MAYASKNKTKQLTTKLTNSFRESRIEEQRRSVFCENNLTLISDINDTKQNHTPIVPVGGDVH